MKQLHLEAIESDPRRSSLVLHRLCSTRQNPTLACGLLFGAGVDTE